MSLEWQLRGILQASDEVDLSCPEVDLHNGDLHIEWHADRRWVMTFAILDDYVAYAMLLGEKSTHGRWELNELVPDKIKALMYEYRDFEDAQVAPPKPNAFRVVCRDGQHHYNTEVVSVNRVWGTDRGKPEVNIPEARKKAEKIRDDLDRTNSCGPHRVEPLIVLRGYADMPIPPKSGPERAAELRVMFQRWPDESPEGYDEEVMAALREEMPHKFEEPSNESI